MEHVEKPETGLLIIIPNADIEDINKIRKGLLSILAKVKIENCDSEFKENLKAVYQLLSHLPLDKDFRNQYRTLVECLRQSELKKIIL